MNTALAAPHTALPDATQTFRPEDFLTRNQEMLGANPDWAVLVLPRVITSDGTCIGYISVVDPKFPNAAHKLPSGKRNRERGDTTPHQTARFELEEETGVSAGSEPSALQFISGRVQKNPKKPGFHAKFLAVADVPEAELAWLYHPEHNPSRHMPDGNEGEIAFFHKPAEFVGLFTDRTFFSVHRHMLEDAEAELRRAECWLLS